MKPPVLVSNAAKEGRGGRWVAFNRDIFDECVLAKLREVTAEDVVDGGGRVVKLVESLTGQIAEVDGLIASWEAKMDDPLIVDRVAKKLSELVARRKELSGKLSDAQRAASTTAAESVGRTSAGWPGC